MKKYNYIAVDNFGRILRAQGSETPLITDGSLIQVDTPVDLNRRDFIYYYDKESDTVVSVVNQEGLTFDYETRQWVDNRSIEDVKVQKWEAIKAERDAFEVGGFTYGGNVYDSDPTSQARIVVAALSGTPQTWTTQDNLVVDLSAAQMIELRDALQAHIANAHARGRAARTAIDEATTIPDVENVTF